MSKNRLLRQSDLLAISEVLGDTDDGLTHKEITEILDICGVRDEFTDETTGQRLFDALLKQQSRDGNRRAILAFIRVAMNPERYVGEPDKFERRRIRLNEELAQCGLEVQGDGELRANRETTKAGSTGKGEGSGCLGVFIGVMMFGAILSIIVRLMIREMTDLMPGEIPVLLLENPLIWLGVLAVVVGPGFVRAIRNWRKVSLSRRLGAIRYDVTDGGGSGARGASPLVTATQISIELIQVIWRLRWSLLWAVLATLFFMVVISVIEAGMGAATRMYYTEHGEDAASPGIQELLEIIGDQIPVDVPPLFVLLFPELFIGVYGPTVLGIVFARRAFRAAANL